MENQGMVFSRGTNRTKNLTGVTPETRFCVHDSGMWTVQPEAWGGIGHSKNATDSLTWKELSQLFSQETEWKTLSLGNQHIPSAIPQTSDKHLPGQALGIQRSSTKSKSWHWQKCSQTRHLRDDLEFGGLWNNQTQVSYTAGRFSTIWAIREAHERTGQSHAKPQSVAQQGAVSGRQLSRK